MSLIPATILTGFLGSGKTTLLKRVLAEANWFGLPGGMELKRDGENERALFLVVTGTLGVFVEGTRQKSGVPGTAQPGAAMVAIQEDVPIVPIQPSSCVVMGGAQ